MIHATLAKMIRNYRQKLATASRTESNHVSFSEERYADDFCEKNCPLQELWEDGIRAECPGGCNVLDYNIRCSMSTIEAADAVIDDVMKNGYEALGVEGLNEPFPLQDHSYANVWWEDACNSEKGICADCTRYETAECPEDILSEDCPRHKDGWAIEHVAEAVNEVIRNEVII